MSSTTRPAASGGIGFCGLLTIVFLTLKLTGFISWSWLWVLAPIWIPIALVLGIVGAIALVAAVFMFFTKVR